MISRNSRNHGRPAWRYYGWLRRHHHQISQFEAEGSNSRNQCAQRLGVTRALYVRLAAGVVKYEGLLSEGERTGDWTGLEDELFAQFGDYRLLPFFKRALALAEGQTEATCTRRRRLPSKRKPEFPPVSADKTPTEIRPTSQQLIDWFNLGRLADRYLTPEGKRVLLDLQG